MVEVCINHSEMERSVGMMRGKLDMIIAQQTIIAEDLKELKDTVSLSSTAAAIERTKIKPFYWIVGGLGVAIFNVLTAIVVASMVNR